MYYFTMIAQGKYIVIDSIPNCKIDEQLCIINFNIVQQKDNLNKFIKKNKQTVFWCVSKDFSKQYIETASDLGIQNVIEYPIQTQLIENFFKNNLVIDSKECFFQYEKLNNSNILIVDDNELNIELLEEILSDLAVCISSFNNPISAVEKINEMHFDLCILDILMPELSGFEVAEVIKKSELNKNTPIVFISAVSGDETIYNGYNLGASSYIEKPFSPRIVKAQIYNILKNREVEHIKTKENDSFIATLTHDLKSPINAEILAIKYMLGNIHNKNYSEQNEILSELLNSAQYMKLITDKILCHYKQKNSDIILNKEIVGMSSIVLSCIEEMRYLANDKEIEIRFYKDIDIDLVEVDILEIKRVINNLIANAIEYSHSNSFIDIRIRSDRADIICEIQDYGIGINLEKYGNIFDEYISLSKEHKKIGFGLGLNICRSIILAHNGDIKISSQPHYGTKISFKLPLVRAIETMKVEE